jgi:hypothetical protein
VVSGWHWTLSSARRDALERWVEAGGRLVVDRTLSGGFDEFQRWSGISRKAKPVPDCDEDCEQETTVESGPTDDCGDWQETREPQVSTGADVPRYRVCGRDAAWSLTSSRTPEWVLRDDSGLHAVRVRIGLGSVTVVDADPFRYRAILDGDHARLLIAATKLRRGDDVRFLSDAERVSLLARIWRDGSPAVVFALVLAVLFLWRGGVRFGPLAPEDTRARRSLAEQIRGTGEFALRYGRGAALHTACVRALDEAGRRRVHGYASLTAEERSAALTRLTRFNRQTLSAAIEHPPLHRPHELRQALAILEAARRRIVKDRRTFSHGTR